MTLSTAEIVGQTFNGPGTLTNLRGPSSWLLIRGTFLKLKDPNAAAGETFVQAVSPDAHYVAGLYLSRDQPGAPQGFVATIATMQR